jgi:hypothetical protein
VRRVLAITMVLLFAALMLSPTMGYSVQIGNHSYSLKATRVSYTFGITAPSHDPAVQVTRVPFSLKYVETPTEPIGKTTKGNITVPVASANVPAPVAQKFLIQGTVYDDRNGNAKMDSNETGLANWTINLEQPSGNVIFKATTDNDGTYGFYSLVPGEYTVIESLETGWSLTSPSEGKYAVNLASNTTMLNFGNKLMPTQIQNATSPSNVSSANVTLAENASLSK